MAWRLARSLETLRDQINARYPNRLKVPDLEGTLGDVRHQARKSDHNPNSRGVVTGMDMTRDPKNGPDFAKLIPLLMRDKRTKYVIFDRKIYNPAIQKGRGRPYTGVNPHQKHIHISVSSDPYMYDRIFPWELQAPTLPVQPLKSEPMIHPLKPVNPPPAPTSGLEQTMNRPDPVRNAPEWAIALYESLGWSHVAAVALVSNLIWESGGNKSVPVTIKFQAHGDKDKSGVHRSHGAGQWNERAGRFKLLKDFATRRGRPWTDPETQMLFLDYELNTRPYKKYGDLLRNATSLEDAMDLALKVWGPSTPHADKRLAIARKLP